jgi:PKD domain
VRRRILAVIALVMALAAVSAPLARADGAGTVTIAPSDGSAPRTLSLAALAGSFDVHDEAYTLRAPDGTTATTTVPDGISLGALLSAAGLDRDPFAYVEAPWPDGSSSSYVLAGRLGDAGAGPPVVWSDARGVHFLRPSAGKGDPNADDDLTFADGSLALDLHGGELLEPRVQASKVVVNAGATVRFRASLAAGALGPGMAFQWYFDGGGYVLGASVAHRFAATGAYKVQLNVVRGAADVTNLPTIVHVRVVAASRKRSGGAAQGSVTGGGAAGGGSDTGGAAGAGSGSGAGGGTGASGAASGGVAAPAQAAPAPAASRRRATALAPGRAAPLPAPQLHGQLVSGTLIASTSAVLPLASGGRAVSAVPDGAAARGPLHVPVGAWVAVGLIAFLALGWALESRHTPPYWQP